LAKRRKPHIIEEQILNITINGNVSEAEIRRLQNEVTTLFKTSIDTIIEKQLDAISNDDVYIELPSLELDIPTITYINPKQFQNQVQKKLEESVTKAIKEELRKVTKTDNPEKQQKVFSKTSILFYFLMNGHFPHWVGARDWTVRQLISNVIESDIRLVGNFIKRYHHRPHIMTRIANQFDDQHLKELLSHFYGRNVNRVFNNIRSLRSAGRSKTGHSKELFVAALSYVLQHDDASQSPIKNDRSFSRYLIQHIEKGKNPIVEDRHVISEFKRSFSDIQLLGYFFEHGAVPYWGSLESSGSLRTLFGRQVNTNLIRVQNLIEANFTKKSFIDRLIYQIDTDDLLLLLDPTPRENIQFIKELTNISTALASTHPNIEKAISPQQQKMVIFRLALSYFIKDGKKRFVKKTFLQSVLDELSSLSKSPVSDLSKVMYRSIKKGGTSPVLKSVMEELDSRLQRDVLLEKKEQKRIKRNVLSLRKRLTQIQQQLKSKTVSTKLIKQLELDKSTIEKQIEGLEKKLDDDTLDQLDLQLEEKRKLIAGMDDKGLLSDDLLENPTLSRINTDLNRLFNRSISTIHLISKDQQKYSKSPSSLLKKKLTKNRLRLQQIDQRLLLFDQSLQSDTLQVEFLLKNLRLSIRQSTSAEEGRRLRAERSRLEKHLTSLTEKIQEVRSQREKIKEVISAIEKTQDAEQEQIKPTRTSKLDYLIFLLKYGSTPWWAEAHEGLSIDDIVADFAQNDLQKLRRALQTVGKYAVAWDRFNQQISDNTRELLINKVYPGLKQQIFDIADVLGIIHSVDHFKSLHSTSKKDFSWRVLLQSLFHSESSFTGSGLLNNVIRQISDRFQISAVNLIDAMHRMSTNRPDRFGKLRQLSSKLLDNESYKELDRKLIKSKREKAQKKKGTFLTDAQKTDIIITFLQTNKIPKLGLDNDVKHIDQIEQIFLDQIDNNRRELSSKLQTLLKQQAVCELLVKQFSIDLQLEIIHLINPRVVIPSTKLFADLSSIQNDDVLFLERVLLLNYVGSKPSQFDVEDYLEQLIRIKSQSSRRDEVGMIEEWKQIARSQINSSKSTIYLKLLAIQSNFLKREIRQSNDTALVESIKEQIRNLAEELSQNSTDMMAKLTVDAFDLDMSRVPPRNPLILEKEIEEIKKQIDTLKKSLKNTSEAISTNALQRDLSRAESMLKKMEWQMPSKIKYYNKQLQNLIERQQQIEQQVLGSNIDTTSYIEDPIENILDKLFETKRYLQNNDSRAVSSLSAIIDELVKPENKTIYQSSISEIKQLIVEQPDAPFLNDLNRLLGAIPGRDNLDLPVYNESFLFENELNAIQKRLNQVAPKRLLDELQDLKDQFTDTPAASLEKWSTLKQLVQDKYVDNILSILEVMYTKRVRMNESVQKATSVLQVDDLQEEVKNLQQTQEKEEKAIRSQLPSDVLSRLTSHLKDIETSFGNLAKSISRRKQDVLREQKEALEKERDLLTIQQKEIKQEIDIIRDSYKPEVVDPTTQKEPSPKKEREVKPPEIEEPLLINNGGLVLLWPFFTRLFGMTKMVVDKEFVDEAAQIKAVQMLQYLATGKLEAAENELVLNKVFVGLPLNTPIPYEFELSEEDTKMLDSLIMGALTNWSRIKGFGPNGFRSTFLMREGNIEQTEEKWKIVIVKKQLDVLLKTIPWGYSFIKLPWLKKVITVEWPVM
jgi:uncharacterized protein YfcZ (UPF0381/DUF406 family)